MASITIPINGHKAPRGSAKKQQKIESFNNSHESDILTVSRES